MPTNNLNHSLVSKSTVAQAAPELPQGSEIDRYVVLEVLGKGGMGVVYKAYDSQLNRGVALKLIRTEQDRRGKAADGSARLLREAQALAQLTHPNVVVVHDVGTIAGQVFVAMELCGGRTLNAWHKETKPSTAEVLEVMMTAGRGLAAAHKAGLIHRDFKPSNVIVGEDGRVRVIDFGLARAGAAQPSAEIVDHRDLEYDDEAETQALDSKISCADDTSELRLSSNGKDLLATPLTRAGTIVGTPMYMAPEQHLGSQVDARADQYSFCVVLYEFLHGRRLFSGKSRKGRVKEVQPKPTQTDVPKWLHGIVMRGLSRTPDGRYPSMEALLDELGHDPDKERRRQRAAQKRKLLVIGSVVLAVVLPLGIWYGLRARTARLCQATAGELGGVWDSATKDAIRTAFLDTKKPYAADTWQRVAGAFDTYTAEWTEMRAEACYARWLSGTQSEEVFDLRMSCLKKRIGELGALVRVFARADAGVVQKAVQAGSSLTGIAICADEEALRAPYPQPKSAEAKAKVSAIRDKLAQVDAFEKTGKYREGLELARKLEEEATAVDYRPVQAEVLDWLGELLHRAGEYKEAETTLYRAARAAAKSRDGLLAARAISSLAFVVGYDQVRHEEGLSLCRTAELLLGLGGGDDALRSQLLNNIGSVFWRQAEYDKALEYYRRSLAIDEKLRGPDHFEVAKSLNNVGVVFEVQGEYDKALTYYRKSLAIYMKGLGPEHPYVSPAFNNMGLVFLRQGEYAMALEYLRKSVAIDQKALGPEHPDVAYALNSIGLVYSKIGKYDQALEYYRKAMVIWQTALGPEHPLVAESLSGIGNVLVDQERLQQAIGPLERALSVCEKKTCQPEPHGRGLFALARALVATDGDNERAIRLVTEARGVFGKASYLSNELEEASAWLKERGVE